jgi:hypothetical protein
LEGGHRMRTMFTLYALFITAALVLYFAVGLMHK